MKIKVLYFAQVSEVTGLPNEEIEIAEGSNSEDLINLLIQKHPDIQKLTFKVAVNQELTRAATTLNEGAEVALLPPFAGG